MKLTDVIISAIIKRGIFYEARNFETTIDIPSEVNGTQKTVKVHIKAEHMSIKVDKEES